MKISNDVKTLPVRSPTSDYQVVVGYDLLPQLSQLVDFQGPVVIVTDTNVGPHYAAGLAGQWSDALVITLPAGEKFKTLDSVREIYERMLAAGIDRKATVVALGGGVINDMAGFAAATYMRGVDFVTCPTSLLAMVDASVGGKTGVDLPQGKNLVGAFKQPRAVIVDLATLRTLPAEEFAAGMAEVIKHGLISSPDLLVEIELRNWRDAMGADPDGETLRRWRQVVVEAIQIKRDIVEEDPYEGGRRALLNLGHTFGHAIEQVSGYAVPHGQAVGIGLVCAANLSARLNHCSPDLQQFIETILVNNHLPTRIPAGLDPQAIAAAMATDKKKEGGKLRFILLEGISAPFISADVPPPAVLETLETLVTPG